MEGGHGMSWHDDWIVVTDLDGTLLDHETYSWEPAAGAVGLLKEHGVPLVFSSSKTLAEMRALAAEVGIHQPMIVENGAAVAWPEGDGYRVETIGRPRDEVVELAHDIQGRLGCRFQGFADWSATDVSRIAGLELHKAALSLDRHGTEPILWADSEEAYEAFVGELAKHGVRAVRGGRFIHLMGEFDKVDGMWRVREALATEGAAPRKVLALGDSPNDEAMLTAADVAVRIRSAKSAEMTIQCPVLLQPDAPGPRGWAEAVLEWWQSRGQPRTQT